MSTPNGSPLEITIDGMSCSHCIARVANALKTIPGVDVKSVALGSASVTLAERSAASAVFAAVHNAGYAARRSQPSLAARTGTCCGGVSGSSCCN